MAKTVQRRWVCPSCSSGVMAPGRPRRDDVRRYCLDCSKKTGRLVERTCPALETKRVASRATSTAKAKTKRQTAARQRARQAAAEKARLDARFRVPHPVTGETVDARREIAKVWRAARKVEPRLAEEPPKLVASRGGGSYAYTYHHKIHLGKGAGWSTLVHEVAHFVQAKRGLALRSDGKRAVHDRAFYYGMKEVMEQLVPGLRISFYRVTSWGYNVDTVIAQQLRAFREEGAA
jgi:hypothetical protein